jgi:hypothetical protein
LGGKGKKLGRRLEIRDPVGRVTSDYPKATYFMCHSADPKGTRTGPTSDG